MSLTLIRLSSEIAQWLAVRADVDLEKVCIIFACKDEQTALKIDGAFRVDLENQTEDLVAYLPGEKRPSPVTMLNRVIRLMALQLFAKVMP